MWLSNEFFNNDRVTAICNTSGGDGAVLVYLKLKLKAGRAGCIDGDVKDLAAMIQVDQNKMFEALYDLMRFGLIDQTANGRFYFNI